MKLSERKAKEVLDFLIHKADPSAKWQIISWFDKFVLQVKFYKDFNVIYRGLLRREDNYEVCLSYSSSYIDMLKMLMDEASQSSIVFYYHSIRNGPYEVIHKMTTLEQILLDMDLNANV